MARKSKKPEAPAGAPDWLVTYGDCMTLLLCFFVIIVSMSEIKEDEKFMKVLESLRVAFGGYQGAAGPVPITNEPSNVLIQRLIELEMPKERQKPGDTQDEAIEGKNWRVTNIRDGIQVVVGGGISFDRFSATLKAEAQERIAGAGEILRGYRTKIIVKGHTTREALPEDSLYDSKRDLSYARAKAVADALVAAGDRAGTAYPRRLRRYRAAGRAGLHGRTPRAEPARRDSRHGGLGRRIRREPVVRRGVLQWRMKSRAQPTRVSRNANNTSLPWASWSR